MENVSVDFSVEMRPDSKLVGKQLFIFEATPPHHKSYTVSYNELNVSINTFILLLKLNISTAFNKTGFNETVL